MSHGCMDRFMVHVDGLSVLLVVVVTAAAAAVPALGMCAVITKLYCCVRTGILKVKTQLSHKVLEYQIVIIIFYLGWGGV